MKARVYMETSVVSYLKSRLSSDMVVAAHQELTRRWWNERASHFEMLVSELVYREAAVGDEVAALELSRWLKRLVASVRSSVLPKN
jgi:hypothetical protein